MLRKVIEPVHREKRDINDAIEGWREDEKHARDEGRFEDSLDDDDAMGDRDIPRWYVVRLYA